MAPDGRQSLDFRYLGMRAREVDRRQVPRTCPSRSTMGVPARPRVAIRGAGGLLCGLRSVLQLHPAEGAKWQLLMVGRHPGKVSHQPPAVRPRVIPKARLRIHPWPRASRNGCERELLRCSAASFFVTISSRTKRVARAASCGIEVDSVENYRLSTETLTG
jgi:hypothetical protein